MFSRDRHSATIKKQTQQRRSDDASSAFSIGRLTTALAGLAIIVGTMSSSSSIIGTAEATHHHAFRKSFHCYRPFDSLSSFSLAAMQAKDNCRLDYQQVVDAAVRVDCYEHGRLYATGTSGDEAQHGQLMDRFGPLPSPTGATFANGGSDRADVVAKNPVDDRDGCYATMFVKSTRAEGYGQKGMVKNDDARYAVKLHTQGGGVVHYKGMDGIGYSTCCMFLNQPSHARCEWQNVTHPPRHTDSTADTPEHGSAGALSGLSDDTPVAPRLEQVVQYCNIEAPRDAAGAYVEHHDGEEEAEDGDDPLGIMGDLGDDNKKGDAKKSKADEALVGYVTKPLHRNIPGTWTMEVLMYRGHTAVGKVVSDFNVTAAMLLKPSAASAQKKGHQRNNAHADDGDDDAAAALAAVKKDVAGAEKDAHLDKSAAAAVVPVVAEGDASAEEKDAPKRGSRHRGKDHHRERHHRKQHHKRGRKDGEEEGGGDADEHQQHGGEGQEEDLANE